MSMNVLFLRKRGEYGYGGPLTMHQFEMKVGEHVKGIWAGDGWPLFKGYEETIHTAVNRLYGDDHPEWVMDRQRDENLNYPRSYRIGAYLSDIHAMRGMGVTMQDGPRGVIRFVNKIGYDAVFMKAMYYCNSEHPDDMFLKQLKPTVYFLPYSVDTELFKPRVKKTDVAMIGSIGKRPLRRLFADQLPEFCRKRGLSSIVAPQRTSPIPGRSGFNAVKIENWPGVYVRSNYAKLLGKTRFLVFCSGRRLYPIQKYFEGMAAGCVCVADRPSSAEELGFVDGENYVEVSAENWESKLDYYIRNPGEAERIAENGRKLIMERHTHDIRAREFISLLKNYPEGGHNE